MSKFKWILAVVCGVLVIIAATQYNSWSAKRKLGNEASLDHFKNELSESLLSPERFDVYLNAGLDMNSIISETGLEDMTILQRLIMKKQNLFARKMIERGFIHGTNNRSQTALMTACLMKNEPLVKLLVEKGADVNARDNDEMTALHYLFEPLQTSTCVEKDSGNVECTLTDAVMDLATAKHQSKILELLMAKGAEPSARNIQGRSILAAAVRRGTPEAVRMILKRLPKADLSPDGGGENLLHAASEGDDPEMVTLVLNEIPGGKKLLEARNQAGMTPVMNVTESSVLRTMADAGANVHAIDKDGNTLLHHIVANGTEEEKFSLIKLALKLGVDPNVANKNGQVALMEAARKCDVTSAAVLYDKTTKVKITRKQLRDIFEMSCEDSGKADKIDRILTANKTISKDNSPVRK